MSTGIQPVTDAPRKTRPRPPSQRFSRGPISHQARGAEYDFPSAVSETIAGDGVVRGLRERSEDELVNASREQLVVALKAEWEHTITAAKRYERMQAELQEQQAQQTALSRSIVAERTRTSAALAEQARLEADIESKEEALNMYRIRGQDLERQVQVLSRKCQQQETAFEAERTASHDSETRLIERVRELSSSNGASFGKPKELDRLQEELADLIVAQSSLLAQLNHLNGDMDNLRRDNRDLRKENRAWEYLVRQQAVDVHFAGRLAEQASEDKRSEKKLPSLVENDESSEMNELALDLEAQTPIVSDTAGFGADLDAISPAVAPLTPTLNPPNARRRLKSRQTYAKGDGIYDLAAELDRAEDIGADADPMNGSSARHKVKAEPDGVALRAEVRDLKEANKALTLYCSKIIDRIIAQEGFEQILSVDYKTRKLATRKTSARPSVQAIQAGLPAPGSATVSRPDADGTDSATRSEILTSTPNDASQGKRARRGFSLDLRNLGLGFGRPPLSSPKPQLRPLSLLGQTPLPTVDGVARKLEPQEEDEEDQRERYRIEASMKLLGIDRVSDSETRNVEPSKAYWKGRMWSRQLQSASKGRQDAVPPQQKPLGASPLARASSLLGPHRSSRLPSSPEPRDDVSPEEAKAALKRFDMQEQEQAKQYSIGRSDGGYTTPSPGALRRASSVRTASNRTILGDLRAQESRPRKSSLVNLMMEKGHKGDDSIDTLWSLGSEGLTPERPRESGVQIGPHRE